MPPSRWGVRYCRLSAVSAADGAGAADGTAVPEGAAPGPAQADSSRQADSARAGRNRRRFMAGHFLSFDPAFMVARAFFKGVSNGRMQKTPRSWTAGSFFAYRSFFCRAQVLSGTATPPARPGRPGSAACPLQSTSAGSCGGTDTCPPSTPPHRPAARPRNSTFSGTRRRARRAQCLSQPIRARPARLAAASPHGRQRGEIRHGLCPSFQAPRRQGTPRLTARRLLLFAPASTF